MYARHRQAESNWILGGMRWRRRLIAQLRDSSDLLPLRPIASFVIAPGDRLDAIVRCSPPRSGYSPNTLKPERAVERFTDTPQPSRSRRCARLVRWATAHINFRGTCCFPVDRYADRLLATEARHAWCVAPLRPPVLAARGRLPV
jgi:hypothetical protein